LWPAVRAKEKEDGMALRPRLTPYNSLWISFAAIILAGWLLLMLPGMTTHPISWVDGLFMSTSAVCVTGLAVLSVGNDFTPLGQLVLLCLLQVGGLGFMTLSSSILMNIRRKVTLGQARTIHETLGGVGGANLPKLLMRCLRMVVLIEGIGALLLFARFCYDVPAGANLWRFFPATAWQAVFHSVSAFCNSGLGLWDDSLARYAGSYLVNFVVGGEIILGGLGFFVLVDVVEWGHARKVRKPAKLKFQSHVVLWTSLVLLLFGALLLWIAEKENSATLLPVSPPKQILAALFQSVTARTAGFSTVNIGNLTNSSLAGMMLLMFIGASPGSCGGGVKTTTFAVIVTLAMGAWRAGKDPNFRGRSFGPVTVASSIALFFAAAFLVITGGLVLMLIETGGLPFARTQGAFVSYLFETISAFATVGLSTGITALLSVPSRLVIIVLMFIGRVGPLGLISATLRGGAQSQVSYPYEDVQIG
jgi:trk system potassium uptake protein TrkH